MCTLDSGVRALSGSFKQKEEGSVFGDALCAEKSRGKGCVQFSNLAVAAFWTCSRSHLSVALLQK